MIDDLRDGSPARQTPQTIADLFVRLQILEPAMIERDARLPIITLHFDTMEDRDLYLQWLRFLSDK